MIGGRTPALSPLEQYRNEILKTEPADPKADASDSTER